MSTLPHNYVFKPTAGDMLQSFRLLLAGSGLTRRYAALMAFLSLFAASLALASAPVDDAALRAMTEAVASYQGIRTRLVCVSVDEQDLPESQRSRIALSHGRLLLPGSECAYRSPYFVHVPSGENAIRIGFSGLSVTPDRVSASFHALASDFDCSGTMVVVQVRGEWVNRSDGKFTCTVA